MCTVRKLQFFTCSVFIKRVQKKNSIIRPSRVELIGIQTTASLLTVSTSNRFRRSDFLSRAGNVRDINRRVENCRS